MRNLIVASLLVSSSLLLPAVALAAPEALRCKAKFDPQKLDPDPASPGWNVNCFAGDVFVLDGTQVVTLPDGAPRSLVDCAEKPGLPGTKNSSNCYIGALTDQLKGASLKPAVDRTLQLLRARVPTLPEWDEILIFRNDFSALSPSTEV